MTMSACEQSPHPLDLPEYIIPSDVQGVRTGNEPGDDNGHIPTRFRASLNSVVSYSEDIAADWFAAGNPRNKDIRHGNRLDYWKSVGKHGYSPRLPSPQAIEKADSLLPSNHFALLAKFRRLSEARAS